MRDFAMLTLAAVLLFFVRKANSKPKPGRRLIEELSRRAVG